MVLLCIHKNFIFVSIVTVKHVFSGDEVKEEEPCVDRTSLKQLTDMGFLEVQAIEALKQNRFKTLFHLHFL